MAQEQAFPVALVATCAFRLEAGRLVFLDRAEAETIGFVPQP